MTWKAIAEGFLPPVAFEFLKRARRAINPSGDGFRYAPDGWQTPLPQGGALDSGDFVARERREWDLAWSQDLDRQALLVFTRPPGFTHRQKLSEHNEWASYAYALLLAAREKGKLKILDYGGSLGYFHQVTNAVVHGVALEYHCKDLPGMVAEGRKVNPDVIWHTDDSCLEERFDLVVISGALQYISDWQELLRRACNAAQDYLFLTGLPIVERVPGYVAIQRVHGAVAHYHILNRTELFATVTAAGLEAVREFVLDEHPRIPGAPEQPAECGWLFRRIDPPA